MIFIRCLLDVYSIFGFLLEDLDRSIFYKREYQKALFVLENDKFQLKNVPIEQNIKEKKINDFYLFRFLHNFYELIINELLNEILLGGGEGAIHY